jgi:hypothetical protein
MNSLLENIDGWIMSNIIIVLRICIIIKLSLLVSVDWQRGEEFYHRYKKYNQNTSKAFSIITG